MAQPSRTETARSHWLGDLSRDLRYGARQLRRAPAFALTAILTLALGIGVSTALFTVVYGTWLDAFPYRDFRSILFPQAWAHNGDFYDSQWGVFRQHEYRQMSTIPAVAEVGAYTLDGGFVTMLGAHGPERVRVFRVPGDTFAFLGVRPLLGRPIQPSDIVETGEAAPVVVLSFNIWQRMWGGNPAVVGQTMAVSGMPQTIVGVMPHRFGWGSASWATNDQIWMPLATTAVNARLRAWIRLREGVSTEVATQQFQAFFTRLAADKTISVPRSSFYAKFDPFEGGVGQTANAVKQMRSSLKFLLFAVGFLLLIACTNVANPQLARGSARRREIAIRLAVGGSRWRVARQLLTENVVLALAAGLVGVGLAFGLTELIVAMIPRGYVPSESQIQVNLPVLIFAVALSTISGLVFGMVPSIHGSKSDLNETLKDTGVGIGGFRGLRTRNLLVIVEIALSVLLVMGATLAVRGYFAVERVDPGMDPRRVLRGDVVFASQTDRPGVVNDDEVRARSVRIHQLMRDLPARLLQLPIVEGAAVHQIVAMFPFEVPGLAVPKDVAQIVQTAIGPGYARTLRAPIVAGRDLTDAEVEHRGPVALVNQLAARLWTAGRTPIGATIKLGSDSTFTVVGVVANISDAAEQPTLFVPLGTTVSNSAPTLFVRTRHEAPLSSANSIRSQIYELNRDAVLQQPEDLQELLSTNLLQPRFNVTLFSALAAIALGLAAAGVYAVLSYQVAQQRREIGIRLALGASTGRIVAGVLRVGAWLVGLGIAAGVGVGVALGRYVTSQVFMVPKLDPITVSAAVSVLVVAATAACYVPARRATKVSPLSALRGE